ncbi:MAG: hypothetical protein JW749_12305 [Sedimentisphaerales bacterium]|nr:hypothetical protein [Sedimentisphaerales bacterium]
MKHTYTFCRDCKWWNRLSEQNAGIHKGECRRYPPMVFFTGLVYHTFCEASKRGFPVTADDCWCGEAHF